MLIVKESLAYFNLFAPKSRDNLERALFPLLKRMYRIMRFIVMYGQSEATAAISYLPAEKALDKPGSVGIVVPGGEIT